MQNDYSIDLFEAIREHNDMIFFDEFFQCMEELDVLTQAKKENRIVLEDVQEVKDDNNKGVFGKIIDFIRRMINKFMETAKNLFTDNKKWFDENAHRFDNIKDDALNKMKITIIPYWKATYSYIRPSLKETDTKIWESFKEGDKLEKAMYPGIMKLSTSSNISEGAKIYYRGGSNTLVAISGNDIRPRISEMLAYCKNYNETVNHIKEVMEKTAEEIERSQTEIDKVRENFCYLEGLPIMETDYSIIPWYDSKGNILVLEGNGNVSNNNANKDKDGKEKPAGAVPTGNGTVQSGDGNNSQNSNDKNKEDDAKKKANEDHVNKHTALKNYWNTVLKVDTAMMTIAEERYHAYVRTLRSILSSVGHEVVDTGKK